MSDARKKRQSGGFRGDNQAQRPLQGQGRSKMNSNNKYQRQSSYDSVRKIVQEEGRSARNLVKFDVPIQPAINEAHSIAPSQSRSGQSLRSPSGKMPRSRSQSASNRPGSSRDPTPPTKKPSDTTLAKSPESRSGGGPATPKKADLRARYWAFLFENLRRAVDEIYHTCETDESVVECKEVIMMLEQCTKDFRSLIQRMELLRAYDDANKEGQRPHSLAWEVRKSSPGKSLGSSGGKEHFLPSPSISRSLNFGVAPAPSKPLDPPAATVSPPAAKPADPVPVTAGNSWADKVRGTAVRPSTTGAPRPTSILPVNLPVKETSSPQPEAPSEVKPQEEAPQQDDQEGWETVHRNSRSRTRPSSLSKSSSGTNSPRILDLQVPGSYKDAHLSLFTKERASSLLETSFKGDGHESEKENRPMTSVSVDNLHILTKDEVHKTNGVQSAASVVRTLSDQGEKYDSARKDSKKQRAELRRHEKREWVRSENFSSEDEEEEMLTNQLENALQTCLAEEDQLEQETQAALESAIQEEEAWLKEIKREESTEIVVETEADTEAENEADNEADSDLGNTCSTLDLSMPKPLDWDTLVEQYDADNQTTSWGDRVEESESRTPGRVVHVHEKLSSPSRKRSPTESRHRHEQKQAKARQLREKLLHEQAERLRMLTKKVEEVHAWKDELMEQRRNTMDRKLERAEVKRRFQLQLKIRKAHQEETKANEIAFINTLEAQNKKHDIMSKHQECEARLQDLQDERVRKHEEKLAKEAAVEERRRAIETERQARLQEMQDRRKQRQTDFELRQREREKERQEAARLKEREREERMAALNAQQQAHIQQLQSKIQKRQDETDRRHKEKLEQIQEKAFRMSILQHSMEDGTEVRQPPKMVPYARKKICTVCNFMIKSEVYLLSHLRGKRHLQALRERSEGRDLSREEIETFNLTHISDVPLDRPDPQIAVAKERQKALKKRCKKLRQRMTQRGSEYEAALSSKPQSADSDHRTKFQKIIKELTKAVSSQDSGPWPQNKLSALDRSLGELTRILEKKVACDQEAFRLLGGLTILSRLLLVISKNAADLPPIIPAKSLVLVCQVFRQVCSNHWDNCHYLLYTNKIASLVDILGHQLSLVMEDKSGASSSNAPVNLSASLTSTILPSLTADPVTAALLHLLDSIFTCLAMEHMPNKANQSEKSSEKMGDSFTGRINDIVSYVVSVGILDWLGQYFSQVRGPVNNEQQVASFLQAGMGFLISSIHLLSSRSSAGDPSHKKKTEDQTQLLAALRATDLAGIVSLLYGTLLHAGAPGRGDLAPPPPALPLHTTHTALMAFSMLNHLSALDLHLLQMTLGEEGTWLEFRHIASYLLWYCSHHSDQEALLHEVILCVGHFTVLNKDNQVIIQSGQAPTVLQQLCSLPFQYFSAPRLTNILFPTLVACCYQSNDNRHILQQELSCSLLANFIEEKKLERQQHDMSSGSSSQKLKASDTDGEERMLLSGRFPEDEWIQAQEYFSS